MHHQLGSEVVCVKDFDYCMNRVIILFLLALSGATYANYQDGYDAAIKGDFKNALKEWQPLADQSNAKAHNNSVICRNKGFNHHEPLNL